MGGAVCLTPSPSLPERVNSIISEASHGWLKSPVIAEFLETLGEMAHLYHPADCAPPVLEPAACCRCCMMRGSQGLCRAYPPCLPPSPLFLPAGPALRDAGLGISEAPPVKPTGESEGHRWWSLQWRIPGKDASMSRIKYPIHDGSRQQTVHC